MSPEAKKKIRKHERICISSKRKPIPEKENCVSYSLVLTLLYASRPNKYFHYKKKCSLSFYVDPLYALVIKGEAWRIGTTYFVSLNSSEEPCPTSHAEAQGYSVRLESLMERV